MCTVPSDRETAELLLSEARLELRLLHQFGNRYAKSLGKLGEGEYRHIVVPSLHATDIATVHFSQQR